MQHLPTGRGQQVRYQAPLTLPPTPPGDAGGMVEPLREPVAIAVTKFPAVTAGSASLPSAEAEALPDVQAELFDVRTAVNRAVRTSTRPWRRSTRPARRRPGCPAPCPATSRSRPAPERSRPQFGTTAPADRCSGLTAWVSAAPWTSCHWRRPRVASVAVAAGRAAQLFISPSYGRVPPLQGVSEARCHLTNRPGPARHRRADRRPVARPDA
jgi:hypothetical protein